MECLEEADQEDSSRKINSRQGQRQRSLALSRCSEGIWRSSVERGSFFIDEAVR